MAKKSLNLVAFKDLNEKQKKAYLLNKREKDLRKTINGVDCAFSTVVSRKIEITSGDYKGYEAVGKDKKEATERLITEVSKKFYEKHPLDEYIPLKEDVKVDIEAINQTILDKEL